MPTILLAPKTQCPGLPSHLISRDYITVTKVKSIKIKPSVYYSNDRHFMISMFETLTGCYWPISQSSSVSGRQATWDRKRMNRQTQLNTLTPHIIPYHEETWKTTVCGCFLHRYNQTHYAQFYNLSRRYLLFTADSHLVTPHAARGAAVAPISGSIRSFASRLRLYILCYYDVVSTRL